jgi:hypothetical protein
MTSAMNTSVSGRPRPLDSQFNAPVALSFTRFVAAHGGGDSLRAADKPAQTVQRNPLTFTRHQWLMSRPPDRAVGNGETV